eukprot:13179508-Ditylum_brightwellii.AAC.1
MSSLYTAVDVLNEEHSGEKEKNVNALKENLYSADEEMARLICIEESQLKNKGPCHVSTSSSSNAGGTAAATSSGCGIWSEESFASPSNSYGASTTNSSQLLLKDTLDLAPSSPPPPPPTTPLQPKSVETLNIKASGYLYKKDRGIFRSTVAAASPKPGTWKKRYFVLHQIQACGTYQLSYGDHPGHGIRSKFGNPITTGVSSVERKDDVPKYPFAFEIHTDPAGKGTELERALKESLMDDHYNMGGASGSDDDVNVEGA